MADLKSLTTPQLTRIKEPFELPNRIYAQYADKPKFVDWMNITRKVGAEISKGAEDVRNSLDVDTATGESLNIIGRIVAVDRIQKEELMNPGVFADPDGTNFGNTENGFSEWSTFTNADLTDQMLRFAIKAKIIKNSANPTCDELLMNFKELFPNAKVFRLINHHDMSFSIEYVGVLSPLEQWLIDLKDFIPTPQGVRLRGFIRSYGIIEFLDDDDFVFDNEELEFL